jgi:hypothetical protein
MAQSSGELQVGDWVELIQGNFQRFQGQIKTVDLDSNRVVIAISIFGHEHPLEFPLSSIHEWCLRFGNLPVVQSSPHNDLYLEDMQSLCPNAETIFATCYHGASRDFGTLCLYRSDGTIRAVTRWSNLTWPLTSSGSRVATRQCLVDLRRWNELLEMLDNIDFWNLPYDNGERHPPSPERSEQRLSGYDQGRFHHVKRANLNGAEPIGAVCEYMHSIYEDADIPLR